MPSSVGGLSEADDVTTSCEIVLAEIRSKFDDQQKPGMPPTPMFKAIRCRHQVVSGINYFVKVQIAADPAVYVHLRIYEPLSGPSQLIAVQTDKTLEDEIEYFEQQQ